MRGSISLETAYMGNCYSHAFCLTDPQHLFGSNSVYKYPTFLTHVFSSPHHKASCLDLFLFKLPKLHIIFIQSPTPISTSFSLMGLLNLCWIFMYEISSPLSVVRTQHFCSFEVWGVSILLLPRAHKSLFLKVGPSNI